MIGLSAGGYDGVSVAGVNIIPEIKESEGFSENISFIIRTISFTPDAECHISINGGTSMTIPSGKTYSNDQVLISSFKIIEDDINYSVVYNY